MKTEKQKEVASESNIEILKAKIASAEKAFKFASSIAGSIAHELKNPLASINIQMDLMDITTNTKAMPLEKKLYCYKRITKSVKKIIKDTTHIIDDFLIKIKSLSTEALEKVELTKISITKNIEESLNTYPFQEKERTLVNVEQGDEFDYLGNSMLTNHVLSNLIKNALRAINEAEKGNITIKLCTNCDSKFNRLESVHLTVSGPKLSSIFILSGK